MKLYRLTTMARWVFYVVAEDETTACHAVESLIHNSDYGFEYERVIVTVELVAQQYSYIEARRNYVSQLLIADTSSNGGQDA